MNYINKFENYLVEDLDLNNPELKETRRGFGDALVDLGKSNPDVVVLGGDVSGSVRT
ncbi:MAG TPA: transketolase family protein, partial [Ignavibacteria bacterium]|nr:transketolase family protein [Ignavibacteria bacterium]